MEECDSGNFGERTCASMGYYGGQLGCTANCTIDDSSCALYGRCGDGVLNGDEACEPGIILTQTCTSLGYNGGSLTCNSDCTLNLSACDGVCGDGEIQEEVGEECDGTNLNGNSCTSLGFYGGLLRCHGTCALDFSSCDGYCGDGAKTNGEECDGTDFGTDSCLSLGYYGGQLTCNSDCTKNISQCVAAGTCGDNITQGPEDCDGSSIPVTCTQYGFYTGTMKCNSDCTANTALCAGTCGDNTIQSTYGEECDGTNLGGSDCLAQGFYGGTLGCTSECNFDVSACDGYCGDGSKTNGEECDNTDFGGLTCDDYGFDSGYLTCTAGCAISTANCEQLCGNGVINTGEECDGSNLGGESCSTVGGGWNSGTLSCNADCTFNSSQCVYLPYCGNGIVDPGEQCDGSSLNGAQCTDVGISSGTVACNTDCTLSYGSCSDIYQWGTSSEDRGTGIALDSAENIVIAGITYGSLNGATAHGGADIFVMKVAPTGTVLWTQTYGTTGSDEAWGVGVDAEDNIYVAARSSGNWPDHTNAGGANAVLLKLDADGNVLWRRYWGTPYEDNIQRARFDSAGNVFVSGRSEGAIDGSTSFGGSDIFFAKYDGDGNKLFLVQQGSSGTDYLGVATPLSDGNIFVSGLYSGAVNGASAIGGYDFGFSLYNSSGVHQWTVMRGSTSNDQPYGVAVDTSGNYLICGNTNGTFYGESPLGQYDALIAQISPLGSVIWSDLVGTSQAEGMGIGAGIDQAGNFFCSGHSNGTMPGASPNQGNADIFLFSYSSGGTSRFVRSWGSSGEDWSGDIVIDSLGNVWITGLATGAMPGNVWHGNRDVFLIHTYGGK